MRVLVKKFGARFGLVTSPREEKAAQRVRGLVYTSDLGSFSLDELDDGRERDSYDERSVHFIVDVPWVLGLSDILLRKQVILPWSPGRRTAGTLRLIRGPRYLMESGYNGGGEPTFDVPSNLDRKVTVEASRLAVLPQFRRLGLSLGLLKAAFIWGRDNNIVNWVAAVNLEVFRRFARLGITFEVIGQPQEYHNITAVPVVLRLEEVFAELRYTKPKLYHFFAEGLEPPRESVQPELAVKRNQAALRLAEQLASTL